MMGFDENLKMGFPRTTNTAYCSTACHNENNYEQSYWTTEKVRCNLLY